MAEVANGVAAPVAPAASAAPTAEERLKTVEAEKENHKREAITSRRLLEQAKKEKLTWGEKLSDYEKVKKENETRAKDLSAMQARLDRAKSVFGDKWTEMVDGAPLTPEQQQAALDKVKSDIREEFASKEKERLTAEQKARDSRDAASRAQLAEEGAQFFKDNAKRFGGFKKFGSEADVGKVLAARIESTWRESKGKTVLTMKDAAEALRKDLLDIHAAFLEDDEYKAEAQKLMAPAVEVPKSSSGEVAAKSKTLTNDLTGTTRQASPKRSDAERQKAADEAFRKIHFK